jgi:hypothetical protein
MFKIMASISVALLALASATEAQPASAGDKELKSYLNAPVWYLEYEVSLKASRQDSRKEGEGEVTTTMSLDRVFSGMVKFDTRMQGPGLTTNQGIENAATMTLEQMMKATQDMTDRIDNVAYWMETPPEFGDDLSAVSAAMKKHMDASMVPARLDYVREIRGENLRNELNTLYNQTTRTTRQGQAKVLPTSSLMFEVDTTAKQYSLSLPFSFKDMSADTKTAKEETVTRTELAGEAPEEVRSEYDISIDMIPRDLTVDDPKALLGNLLVVHGDLDASGKISGERSFKVHFDDDNVPTAGTLVLRYTLTQTPPAKGK